MGGLRDEEAGASSLHLGQVCCESQTSGLGHSGAGSLKLIYLPV